MLELFVEYYLVRITSRDMEICHNVQLEVMREMNACIEYFFEKNQEKT